MSNQIFEKKNVLVTGGAGFFGSHLCERLLKEANVICMDNFSNSSAENINHLLQYPDFEFINCDVNKPIDLDKFDELDKFKVKFQGIQEIYHLACPTNPKDFEKLKLEALWSNSSAMINTLDLAAKYHAKYVFTSSSVVYGEPTAKKHIFTESDQGIVNQLSARACYDEGKRFAETCVETYFQMHGIDAKIARFSTSLCYVSDIIDGLVRLMAAGPEVRLVNLGGDTIYKMADIAKQIIKLTNSTSQVVFEKPLLFLTQKGAPDLAYAKDVLGWMPLVRLEDGLQKAIDYVIANKEALLFNHL
ncbi:MAG: NAD-dependent epimerase/dehydratase family protein [Candidatus Magasanikbacteria bacterium GW2011_GWA2_37_8]|uniref:NAD-dependent epimerase/dehydratase family protein n=1 Tax=Candidatus Magasanikbacteria bacterium GW2011_GWA2_37_8 TaxID=1619036 RepID=A0A0G0HNW3_9BACT|nr:MAG: NAD-dependent epimerase/dehydratase family protein [Candidatus Magasanikbacteria bacterium GW2011_GWA2_37_8]